jgi:hypothetical protein
MNDLANLSIQQFVKERFVNAVLTFGKEQHIHADGSVTLDAQYTDVNTAQLYRPAIELRRFCRAQQGQWAVEHIDFGRERFESEVARRRVEEQQFCADPKNSTGPSLEGTQQADAPPGNTTLQSRTFITTAKGEFALTPGATIEQCTDAQEQTREHRMRNFQQITEAEAAVPPDVAGRFSCNQATQAKHPRWSVTITPIDFEQGESGTLKASRLTLLIAP